MANKLTASKEYDKVDEVYQTLISNGRKSNNASLVAQAYSNYIAWKDSTDAFPSTIFGLKAGSWTSKFVSALSLMKKPN